MENNDIINKALEVMRENEQIEETKELIASNTKEFVFEEKIYRVRKPKKIEKQQIRDLMNKYRIELLRDPKNTTAEELIKLYLKRDIPIDIPKKEKQIRQLQSQIENLAIPAIEAVAENIQEKKVEEILRLQREQKEIQYEIYELLSCSIEHQIKEYIQQILIVFCLEKQEENNWVKVFNSYDHFMSDENNDKLIFKAAYYLAKLMNNEEI